MGKSREPIPCSDLTAQLLELGVTPGSVLLVHTAFSRVGPVEDGPRGLVRALCAAMEPSGTLVMPSMSDDDNHPFDLRRTPCAGMGVVADTFWRMPDVLRSDSPHAFAAIGPKAARIVADHPPHMPHGPGSPVGRVYELDGQVLLLGAGHDANTTIHLAETLAGVRYRRQKFLTLLERGQVIRLTYDEVDHCCEKFDLVDEWLDKAGMQRRGRVGYGEARLMRAPRSIADAQDGAGSTPVQSGAQEAGSVAPAGRAGRAVSRDQPLRRVLLRGRAAVPSIRAPQRAGAAGRTHQMSAPL